MGWISNTVFKDIMIKKDVSSVAGSRVLSIVLIISTNMRNELILRYLTFMTEVYVSILFFINVFLL